MAAPLTASKLAARMFSDPTGTRPAARDFTDVDLPDASVDEAPHEEDARMTGQQKQSLEKITTPVT